MDAFSLDSSTIDPLLYVDPSFMAEMIMVMDMRWWYAMLTMPYQGDKSGTISPEGSEFSGGT